MKVQINQSSGFNVVLEKSFPAIVFLIGFVYFCLRILGFGMEYIPGDLGDSRFINFLLEHGHQWIIGNESSFWSAEFMYPFKNSIALSDNMIGTLPYYSIWRFLGFEMETSYQLWWLSACALNYWVCYWVLRKWKQSVIVAALLSWLFAFSIFNIGQLNYMQMIVRFMVPVGFYAAAKLVTTPSKKYFALYLFAIIVQTYSVMYTGIYLFYFSLLFIGLLCFFGKQFKSLGFYLKKDQLLYTSVSIIVFAIFMGMLLWPYQEMSKTVGLRLFREVTPNLPGFTSFLLPQEGSISWHFLSESMKPEVKEYWLHYLFPGMLLFITLIASPFYLLYAHFKKIELSTEIKVFIISAFVIALVHLHFGNNITLYAAIFKLPGINSIRVPIRFMHVELFLLVFILGYFIKNFKPAILLIVFFVAFADNLFNPLLMPRNKKEELVSRREQLVKEIKQNIAQNQKIIAVTDTITPAFITHIDAMIASQELHLKTLNGYSSYCHDNFGEFFNKCNSSGMNKWIQFSNLRSEEILVIDRNKSKQ